MQILCKEPARLPLVHPADRSIGFGAVVLGTLAILGAGLLIWILLGPAAAQTTPPASDTTVNIGPLIGRIIDTVQPIIDQGILWGVGGIVGFVAVTYSRLLNRQLEEGHRKTLEAAVKNGALLVADKVISFVEAKADISVDVRHAWIADLIRPYVETSAPDALVALRVTDAKLDEKIDSALNAVILAAKTGTPVAVSASAGASV